MWSWPTLRYICLEGLRKTSQDSQFPGYKGLKNNMFECNGPSYYLRSYSYGNMYSKATALVAVTYISIVTASLHSSKEHTGIAIYKMSEQTFKYVDYTGGPKL
jgi:hypothetical protein